MAAARDYTHDFCTVCDIETSFQCFKNITNENGCLSLPVYPCLMVSLVSGYSCQDIAERVNIVHSASGSPSSPLRLQGWIQSPLRRFDMQLWRAAQSLGDTSTIYPTPDILILGQQNTPGANSGHVPQQCSKYPGLSLFIEWPLSSPSPPYSKAVNKPSAKFSQSRTELLET